MLRHLLYILLGLLGMVLGFWGAYAWRQPYATMVAWCAPVGLVLTVLGTVLFLIPNFFG